MTNEQITTNSITTESTIQQKPKLKWTRLEINPDVSLCIYSNNNNDNKKVRVSKLRTIVP